MNIDEIVNRYFNTDKGYLFLVDFVKQRCPTLKINEENLKTLKVETMNVDYHRKTLQSGVYTARDNTIRIFLGKDENGNNFYEKEFTDEEIINTFLHELIHAMTSKVIDENTIVEGINTRNIEAIPYVGINEGITQMITDDVLGKESDAYQVETLFARQLATIVGYDKLLAIYSSNNVNLLLDELRPISKIDPEMVLANFSYLHYYLNRYELDIDVGSSRLGTKIQQYFADTYISSRVERDNEFIDLLITSEKLNRFGIYEPVVFRDVDRIHTMMKERIM